MTNTPTASPRPAPPRQPPLQAYRHALEDVAQKLSTFQPDFLAQHTLDGVLTTVRTTLDDYPTQGSQPLDDQDYLLQEGSAWFTMRTLSVRLYSTDEGIVCDMYVKDRESDGTIASCYAFFSEGEDLPDANKTATPEHPASSHHFIIRSTTERDEVTGEYLYWSNTDGWVDRQSATLFNDPTIKDPHTGVREAIEPIWTPRPIDTDSETTPPLPTPHWVDLPSPDCIGNPDAPMLNMGTFDNAIDACRFAQQHFGTDAVGRLSLVTPAPEPPEQALLQAAQAARTALEHRIKTNNITQEEYAVYEALTTTLAGLRPQTQTAQSSPFGRSTIVGT